MSSTFLEFLYNLLYLDKPVINRSKEDDNSYFTTMFCVFFRKFKQKAFIFSAKTGFFWLPWFRTKRDRTLVFTYFDYFSKISLKRLKKRLSDIYFVKNHTNKNMLLFYTLKIINFSILKSFSSLSNKFIVEQIEQSTTK